MHKMRRNRKPKQWLIVFLLVLSGVFIYVEAINWNSKEMTIRQKIAKACYPLLMSMGKLFSQRSKMKKNPSHLAPSASFYQLMTTANNGEQIRFERFRGRKVLLVNTASECGFTPQYDELERLQEQFRDKLVVLGFPSNDFGAQERGSDEEIASFCKKNYRISFTLAKKSSVAKGSSQNKIFEWLSHKDENGWNDQDPTWNFSKYLVNEDGILTHYFDPSLSPLSDDVVEAIK